MPAVLMIERVRLETPSRPFRTYLGRYSAYRHYSHIYIQSSEPWSHVNCVDTRIASRGTNRITTVVGPRVFRHSFTLACHLLSEIMVPEVLIWKVISPRHGRGNQQNVPMNSMEVFISYPSFTFREALYVGRYGIDLSGYLSVDARDCSIRL